MNVFIDYHHGDLLYSLHLLFEKRLGFTVYRPIGLDWFNEGYWKLAQPINNNIQVVHQFLHADHFLTEKKYVKDGIHYFYDKSHDYFHKAITLEQFKSMSFDLIISTYDLHDITFDELRKKYQPQAKMIAQMGNVFQRSHLLNIMHSVPFSPTPDQHAILMHQEIDPTLFFYEFPNETTKNVYAISGIMQYPEVYHTYKKLLPECNFKYFSANGIDAYLDGAPEVSKKIREANLGWSLKTFGGLGHVNMGWACSGRAIITNMTQQRHFGGLALKLFEPGVTCIDLDSGTVEENCKLIQEWIKPENVLKHGVALRTRFLELVNYDDEEMKFRKWLKNLL